MNRLMMMLAPLVLCLFLPNANSASFDCAKASSKIESLICSDSTLSALDEKLSAAYKTAMKNTGNQASLRQEQKQWLLQRNECIDTTCLVNSYVTRIVKLLTPRTDLPARSINAADRKACQIIAENLNNNSLRTLFINPSANAPSEEEIVKIFGEGAYLGSYWAVDLNNDGIQDHLLIRTDGSANFTSVFARSGRKNSVPTSMGTDSAESSDAIKLFSPLSSVDVIRVEDRVYHFDEYSLWNLSKEGKFQAVCQFDEFGKPLTVITNGNSNPVCTKIFADGKEVKHIPYAPEYGLGDLLPDEKRFQRVERAQDIVGARVDIDNDGKLENVVRLERSFLGGRTCSALILAVSDWGGMRIPDTKLNNLLLDDLGSDPCGPNLDLLVHDGITYIDAIYSRKTYSDPLDKGGHKIYRIEKNVANAVCETKTRANVQAVGVKMPH